MRAILRGPSNGAFIQQLERLFQHGTAVGLTEGELLERFVAARDEAAFEALIARHGPMVLGVCRRLLRDPNDVDDAFQATFLILVRKAGSLQRCDLLGNWLYGVAHRVAKRAQILAARRFARTAHGRDIVDQIDAGHGRRNGDHPSMNEPEPAPWLHDEVRRLPETYRTVVLLCYFERLTYEEAAARLRCPVGTVKGRLARAREILRKRLLRRGVGVSAAVLEWHLVLPDLQVPVPEPLKIVTLNAALAVAGTTGGSALTATSVSLSVATLTDGVLRTMNPINLKALALALMAAGAMTTGLVVAAAQGPAVPDDPADPPRAAGASTDESTGSIAQAKADNRNAAKAKRQASASAKSKQQGEAAAVEQPGGGAAGGMMRMGGGFGGMGAGGAASGGELVEDANVIRMDIAELSAALAVWDKTPQNEAILQELDKPLVMAFARPTPLDEVLKYIKSTTAKRGGAVKIPIYVDPIGLEQAEVKLDSKVIIDLDGAPLKTSLRLMLKQLGLAYCVRDGVLIISSVEGIHTELAEAARELMGSGKNDQIDFRTLTRTGIVRRGMMGGMMMGGMGGGAGAGAGMR